MISPVLIYRTSSFDELTAYRDRIGADIWRDMEAKVYHALNVLRPGRWYNIAEQVAPERQELFVKCCCVYILEQQPGCPHPVAFHDGNIVKRY